MIKLFFLGLVMTSFFTPAIIMAADEPIEFRPNVTIPGSVFKVGEDVAVQETGQPLLLVRYIQAIYKFFVGIAGIIAVFMIVFGGVNWVFSGGSSEKISRAKEIIIGAISGLVLAVGSYMILNTINPSLVNFQLQLENVPGFVLPAYWCQDVNIPAELANPEFVDLGNGDKAKQGETLCGRSYYVPYYPGQPISGTNAQCKGNICSGEQICGFSFPGDKMVNQCMSAQQACNAITDGKAEEFGFTESQAACDNLNIPASQGACLWIDFPAISLSGGFSDNCKFYSVSQLQNYCKVNDNFISSCEQYNSLGFSLSPGAALPYREAFCLTDACAAVANRQNLDCNWASSSCRD